jgi:hypothetical protein
MITSGLNPNMRVQGGINDKVATPTIAGDIPGKPIYADLSLAKADGFKANEVLITDHKLVLGALSRFDSSDLDASKRMRFKVKPSHSMWIRSDEDLAYYADVVRGILNSNHGLPEGEIEDFEKYGYQIDHKPHWHVPAKGYITEGIGMEAAANHAADLAIAVLDKMGVAEYREMLPYKPYPHATNGGAPHYGKGELSFLTDLSIAALGYKRNKIGAGYLEWGHSWWNNNLPPHAITTLRSKLTRKAVPILSRRGNNVMKVGESHRITDTRLAYMGARYVNMVASRAGSNLNYALYHFPSFSHSTPDKTAKFLDEFSSSTPFSLDYSGYDISMSAVLQKALYRVYARYCTPGELEMLWEQLQCSVMTGPVKGLHSVGFMADKLGQLSSGTRTTSADGCVLNMMASLYAMQKATGMSDADTVNGFINMRFGFLWWGDDTVVLPPTDVKFSKDDYLDALGDLNLVATTLDEVVFLKKRFFKDEMGKYQWHPIVSRSYQNSLCGEFARGITDHNDAMHVREVKIMTLLRLYARLQVLKDHRRGRLWNRSW